MPEGARLKKKKKIHLRESYKRSILAKFRKCQPTPVFLPEKFHGQSSLAGYSARGHKESDRTEPLSTHAQGHNVQANIWLQFGYNVNLFA